MGQSAQGNGAGGTGAGPVDGIDAAGVTDWFARHVPAASAPLEFQLIAGGHSNLTYSVTDATGARWVLRRPPLGQVLATAHDMGREHRIISALGPTDVPVPPTVGLCTDAAVNGAPFYVMDFVDGRVIRSHADAESLGPDERRRAGESIVDVMAAIHAVDVDAVGLGDLGQEAGLHRPPAQALVRAVPGLRRPGAGRAGPRRRAPGPRPAGRQHPGPAGSGHRARRLPPGQLHAGPRRCRHGRPRLGDLHAGRPAGRRGAALGLLVRRRRRPPSCPRPPPPPWTASPASAS